MTTQLITWATQMGGDDSVRFLIDEVRDSLAGTFDADGLDRVTDAIQDALYAERT